LSYKSRTFVAAKRLQISARLAGSAQMRALPCVRGVKSLSNGGVAPHFDQNPSGYARSYFEPDTWLNLFFNRRQTIISRYLDRLDRGLVLDLGCGPGVNAQLCVDRGLQYHGIDISPRTVQEARLRYHDGQEATFAAADARHIQLAKATVDLILCLGMLEYVSLNDEPLYLVEMLRVLKPGGVILFSFLNVRSPFWLWLDYAYPPLKFLAKNLVACFKRSKFIDIDSCRIEPLKSRKFGFGERTRLMRRMKLTVIGGEYFAFDLCPPPLSSRIPTHSMRASSWIEALLRRKGFMWLGLGFVIAVRKPASAD
jgi:SAM-dependent methyltransferase